LRQVQDVLQRLVIESLYRVYRICRLPLDGGHGLIPVLARWVGRCVTEKLGVSRSRSAKSRERTGYAGEPKLIRDRSARCQRRLEEEAAPRRCGTRYERLKDEGEVEDELEEGGKLRCRDWSPSHLTDSAVSPSLAGLIVLLPLTQLHLGHGRSREKRTHCCQQVPSVHRHLVVHGLLL
jgi:hypothetical protein